ncbi:hypothetical protein [Dysgonomonas macrotermitis]|uniref:TNF family profile domain-containing protein n=1 Tax=Dysgonomonas macrotermitis TaxID=1346286 RepID=A0A1M5FDN8_9BACT|nr:hypothetical protein [Dysgonomonas macrotermitis]SHF89201.1 hypothetical protein SAMN05444362_111129 [Dysgonomonas macrotermitis]
MHYIKYITLISSLIFSLNIHSQIGIQTDFPRTLFHIDGAKDNPQNGASAVTTTQQQNDITIDTNGRMGLGTISPQAKLHIEHSKIVSGDEYGLKLTPGYGGPSILALQNDGQTVKWEANPSLGQQAQFQVQPTVFPYINNIPTNMTKLNGSLSLSGSDKILIPTEGRYLLTFDMIGLTTFDTRYAPPYQSSIYIYLYKYNTLTGTAEAVDAMEHYMTITQSTGEYMAFPTALYAGYCYTTDYLYIVFRPTVAYGAGEIPDTLYNGNYTVTSDKPCIITIYNI